MDSLEFVRGQRTPGYSRMPTGSPEVYERGFSIGKVPSTISGSIGTYNNNNMVAGDSYRTQHAWIMINAYRPEKSLLFFVQVLLNISFSTFFRKT